MPHRRRQLAMLATAVALTVAPACSTSSNSPQQTMPQRTTPSQTSTGAPAPTTSASPATPQVHGAYEQCLTDHGVPSPAGGPPPGPGVAPNGPAPGPAQDTPATTTSPPGVDQATWDKAVSACASLRTTPTQ
jgi:hypothetical protein